jgi:hypothetical protein
MYVRKHICLFIGLTNLTIAQKLHDIPLPLIIDLTLKVYLSPHGNDKTNGSKNLPLQEVRMGI